MKKGFSNITVLLMEIFLFHLGKINYKKGGDNVMKRSIIILLAFVIVASVSAGAMALGPGYGKGPMWANLSTEDAQNFAKFQSETLPLRQKMLEIRADIAKLMAQTPIDWDAIAEKQKKLAEIRTEIQKRAYEYGVSGCGNCNRGCGNPMGMGRMMM